MMYLKGGQIIDPVEEEIYRADLEIEDGRIRKILKEGGQAPKEAEVLEVPGLMIAPGPFPMCWRRGSRPASEFIPVHRLQWE